MCVLEGILGFFPPRGLSKLVEALSVRDAFAVYFVCPGDTPIGAGLHYAAVNAVVLRMSPNL